MTMAKVAAPKKPSAPKRPSSKSKTGRAECSQAASNWQLSRRGKEALRPDTFAILGKCRALAHARNKADAYGRTGKLSDQGAAALSGRLDKRFDQGLVSEKSRKAKLAELLAKRKAAQGAAGVGAKSASTETASKPRLSKNAETYSRGERLLIISAKTQAALFEAKQKVRDSPSFPKTSKAQSNAYRKDAQVSLLSDRIARMHRVKEFSDAVHSGTSPLGAEYRSVVHSASISRKAFEESIQKRASRKATTQTDQTPSKYSLGGQPAPLNVKDLPAPKKLASVDVALRKAWTEDRKFEPKTVETADVQLPSSMGGPKRGYVARITGTDPKYGLKREFLRGNRSMTGGEYRIESRGLYEIRTESERNRASQEVVLIGRNKERTIRDKAEAKRIAGLMERLRRRS